MHELISHAQEDAENLQILHYANGNQYFQEHRDYFDPKEDPPENFEQGGNRMVTAILYLKTPEEVSPAVLGCSHSLQTCISTAVVDKAGMYFLSPVARYFLTLLRLRTGSITVVSISVFFDLTPGFASITVIIDVKNSVK